MSVDRIEGSSREFADTLRVWPSRDSNTILLSVPGVTQQKGGSVPTSHIPELSTTTRPADDMGLIGLAVDKGRSQVSIEGQLTDSLATKRSRLGMRFCDEMPPGRW